MVPQKAKILLVDDEDTILFAFQKVLLEPGIVIDTAQTLEDAASLLRERAYRAVIADLRLSSTATTEGFDVIQLARGTQADCRIIVVTAYGEESIREQVFELGADYYLEKPVSPHRVKEVLRAMGVY
jgi:two-component system response regulator HydG